MLTGATVKSLSNLSWCAGHHGNYNYNKVIDLVQCFQNGLVKIFYMYSSLKSNLTMISSSRMGRHLCLRFAEAFAARAIVPLRFDWVEIGIVCELHEVGIGSW